MRISDWSSDVCSSDLGIAVTRSTNSVDDLIDGVKIDLLAASPGTPVTIGTTRPIASLEQVVTDFVDTYNHMLALLKEDTNPIRSEEHTSELQSLMRISYAVFCLKNKTPHIMSRQTKTRTKEKPQ